MNVFEDGSQLTDKDIKKANDEIVGVLLKYTLSLVAARRVIEKLNLDNYATLKPIEY